MRSGLREPSSRAFRCRPGRRLVHARRARTPGWGSTRLRLAGAGVAVLALAGCAGLRPVFSAAGTPHFLQVDERLYRGGQPTPEGVRRLAAMGIRTVVSLRAEGRRGREEERRLVEQAGMRWVVLPMHAVWRPTDAQAQRFLEIVRDPEQAPVFVHCRRGEDRTGVIVAIYRVVEQDWNPERAYVEARTLGMAGWNPFMREAIFYRAPRSYARIARLREPAQDLARSALTGDRL